MGLSVKKFFDKYTAEDFRNYYETHHADDLCNYFGITYDVFQQIKKQLNITKRSQKLKNRVTAKNTYHFYTDGKRQIRVPYNQEPPEGFVRGGAPASEAAKAKVGQTRIERHIPSPSKGKIKYTNGTTDIYLDKEAEIPEGFYKGSSKKGCFAYHKGSEIRYFHINDEIPDGWVKGELKDRVSRRNQNSRKQKLDNLTKFELENNCTKRSTLLKQYGYGWISAKWFYSTLTEIRYRGVVFISNTEVSKIAEFKADRHHSKKLQIDEFELKNNCTNLQKLIQRYGQLKYLLQLPTLSLGYNKFIDNKYLPEIENAYKQRYLGSSDLEHELLDFIKNNYDGPIECGIRTVIQNPTSRYGLELDIYLPEKSLAFEFNGVYWHSSQTGTPKDYHFKKSELCQQKGIRLIHIYQDEWIDKQDKIKQLILIALGKVTNRIYARNCIVKQITNNEAKEFSNKTHLQGHRKASITYGLFYNNELVQLMSFAKTANAKSNGAEWEIIRGCPGSNNIVIGGVSKLFKHFIKDFNPGSIFSYCDFNKFDGKSYEALGMTFIGYTGPDKYWIVNDRMIPRSPNKYKELKEQAQGILWGAGSKKYIWSNANENN